MPEREQQPDEIRVDDAGPLTTPSPEAPNSDDDTELMALMTDSFRLMKPGFAELIRDEEGPKQITPRLPWSDPSCDRCGRSKKYRQVRRI
jgi:hypothetical protein